MADIEYDEFLTKCTNIPYKDYSWLKDHCYRTLKKPCSPNVRNEHLAILDLIKEHEEKQEPKTGHWNVWDTSSFDWTYKCDRCGYIVKRTSNYCPNCGRRMFEPQESEG